MAKRKKYRFTSRQRKYLKQWAEWLDETDLPQGIEYLKGYESKEEYVEHLDDWVDIYDANASYCCLGIYVEMRCPERFTDRDSSGAVQCPTYEGEVGSYFCNVAYLPFDLSEELGVYADDVARNEYQHPLNNLQTEFTWLNDNHHYTFKMIAAEIRNLLEFGDWTLETDKILDEHRIVKQYAGV